MVVTSGVVRSDDPVIDVDAVGVVIRVVVNIMVVDDDDFVNDDAVDVE